MNDLIGALGKRVSERLDKQGPCHLGVLGPLREVVLETHQGVNNLLLVGGKLSMLGA